MVLTETDSFSLYVEKEGYLFQSVSFEKEDAQDAKPILIDIKLKRPSKGDKVVMNHIYFAFDSDQILPQSKPELEKAATLIKSNTKLKFEIGGHTDSSGSEKYNLELSTRRALSVYDYLLQIGVPKGQISYKGYGEKRPFNSNNDDKSNALNRRIEIIVQN